MISNYIVTGMTCGHCATAVQGEVSKLPGVSRVEVDLATGGVRVTSDAPLEAQELRAAVEEAGYQLIGPSDGES